MCEMFEKSSLSRRLLSTFNISDEILRKLKSKGFTMKSEIQILSDSKLQSICGLNESQLEVINRVVRNSHKSALKCMSVLQRMALPYEVIHTGSYSMDRAMIGGLQVSKITQISSEAGAGKTQICMQCCVNVQFPPKLGGLSGHALYIDTEDSFRPERITSMAQNRLSKHPDLMPSLTPEIIKSQIHVIRSITDSNDFIDLVVNRIEPFIDKNPEIRLVVIDSIAQHFRYDYRGTDSQKDYELTLIGHKLKEIAHSKKVAVLIANQVTFNTKLRQTVPALGKYWQNCCTISLFFQRNEFGLPDVFRLSNVPGMYRSGTVIRSNETEVGTKFYFDVTANGIEELLPGDWYTQF